MTFAAAVNGVGNGMYIPLAEAVRAVDGRVPWLFLIGTSLLAARSPKASADVVSAA
ncbi:hypothetical protein ABZ930_05730 [Streptomyces sp. NPDC046716]|uniref:hypothetical protein n=1 Tax=Streptomyces sp. NPDC046716 TaxID=3157093 RepID=UPI0033F73A08